MKKVACFFTGGYTESGAMQEFLKKVNANLSFKQFCPNKPKRRWVPGLSLNDQPKIESDLSGLTGASLIRYVNEYIDDHSDELQEYDAVLIEDDLDDRFFIELIPGDSRTKQIFKSDEFLSCLSIKYRYFTTCIITISTSRTHSSGIIDRSDHSLGLCRTNDSE